jgi:YD repeat-containing protein
MNLVAPYRDQQLLIKYEYDKSGNLITVYDALNSPYKYSYKNNLLVQLTHRDGLSFYYEYDKYSRDGRCIHSWGDGGLYDYRFVYREEDRITEVTDSLGNTSYIKYDERYMITEDTNPLGGTTCYEYDEVGRTISVTDPDGNRTGYEYDRRGICKTYTA